MIILRNICLKTTNFPLLLVMGIFLSLLTRRIENMFGPEHRRILLLGLDAAGKSTILFKLNTGESPHTVPTIGFNVENIRYKNIEFNAWDIGGKCQTLMVTMPTLCWNFSP